MCGAAPRRARQHAQGVSRLSPACCAGRPLQPWGLGWPLTVAGLLQTTQPAGACAPHAQLGGKIKDRSDSEPRAGRPPPAVHVVHCVRHDAAARVPSCGTPPSLRCWVVRDTCVGCRPGPAAAGSGWGTLRHVLPGVGECSAFACSGARALVRRRRCASAPDPSQATEGRVSREGGFTSTPDLPCTVMHRLMTVPRAWAGVGTALAEEEADLDLGSLIFGKVQGTPHWPAMVRTSPAAAAHHVVIRHSFPHPHLPVVRRALGGQDPIRHRCVCFREASTPQTRHDPVRAPYDITQATATTRCS